MEITKFLSLNPTIVGCVKGVLFYEDPIKGDESPLIKIVGDKVIETDFFDLPAWNDVF